MAFSGLVNPWCKLCCERHSAGDLCCIKALAAAVKARRDAPPGGCNIADWPTSWKSNELDKIDTASDVYLRHGGEYGGVSIANCPEGWSPITQAASVDYHKQQAASQRVGPDGQPETERDRFLRIGSLR